MGRSVDAVRRLWTRGRAADARDRSQGMKDDEQTAPEDPLVSSLTAYHESRAKGSTEIRPSDAPGRGRSRVRRTALAGPSVPPTAGPALVRGRSHRRHGRDCSRRFCPRLWESCPPGEAGPDSNRSVPDSTRAGAGSILESCSWRSIRPSAAKWHWQGRPSRDDRHAAVPPALLAGGGRGRARPRPNSSASSSRASGGRFATSPKSIVPGRRWRRGSSSGPNPSLWRRPPGWWPLSPRHRLRPQSGDHPPRSQAEQCDARPERGGDLPSPPPAKTKGSNSFRRSPISDWPNCSRAVRTKPAAAQSSERPLNGTRAGGRPAGRGRPPDRHPCLGRDPLRDADRPSPICRRHRRGDVEACRPG